MNLLVVVEVVAENVLDAGRIGNAEKVGLAEEIELERLLAEVARRLKQLRTNWQDEVASWQHKHSPEVDT